MVSLCHCEQTRGLPDTLADRSVEVAMAGFHFNSGIMRLSAIYHRSLRVITNDSRKNQMVGDLLPKLTYAGTPALSQRFTRK